MIASRPDGRAADELRSFSFERDFTKMADGSTLVTFGQTRVLCTASVNKDLPPWLRNSKEGWVTAEYSMLPGSSPERVPRRSGGREKEIQRLIGRSLRAVVDMTALGPISITVDCDVIQADGGTRTASICGGFVALHDAITRHRQAGQVKGDPILTECAAISVGVVDGIAVLDLPYAEDSTADVDCNIVMTGDGNLIEIQGTAEEQSFSRSQLDEMLDLAQSGISQIITRQKDLLNTPPT